MKPDKDYNIDTIYNSLRLVRLTISKLQGQICEKYPKKSLSRVNLKIKS